MTQSALATKVCGEFLRYAKLDALTPLFFTSVIVFTRMCQHYSYTTVRVSSHGIETNKTRCRIMSHPQKGRQFQIRNNRGESYSHTVVRGNFYFFLPTSVIYFLVGYGFDFSTSNDNVDIRVSQTHVWFSVICVI